ncbi:MAG: Sua5/YciO/YrdC/YwlC family protein [Bacteroidota bacterium]|nr:Sua5/YciO/YrdC/YwlC family protein [Bacteroidota bacterium]
MRPQVLKLYLPGPFKLIHPVTKKPPKALGKCNSIAVRIPNHEVICGLIDALGPTIGISITSPCR